MLETLTDDELIQRYVQNNDSLAFDALTLRHRDFICWHFEKNSEQDAEDLAQKLLMKLLKKLSSYKAEGKFRAYLSVLIKNMLIDHWRSKSQKIINNSFSDSNNETILSLYDERNIERGIDAEQKLKQIIENLIAQLPCQQRMAFLLMHESNFWEGKQKLSWHHMAALNGISPEQAATLFLKARDELLLKNEDIACEELLIFMVWSQCQRIDKNQKFTMTYFANLLGIKLNTFKTREREAKNLLKSWINRSN